MMKATMTALAAVALLAGCNQGPPPPEKTIQQLMADDVDPAAQTYWKSVQYISDIDRGEYEILPESDADWKKVRDAATRLGELGELLQTPGYAEGRGEDWMQFARSLVEVSALAEKTADDRSTDAVFAVGGTVYSVCKACHDVYPPAEGVPGEGDTRPGES